MSAFVDERQVWIPSNHFHRRIFTASIIVCIDMKATGEKLQLKISWVQMLETKISLVKNLLR